MAAVLFGLGLPMHAMAAWVAGWAAAPQNLADLPMPPGLSAPELKVAGTLRQRIVPTLDGPRVRVRFSNLFGQRPLQIAAATVAASAGDDSVVPSGMQALRFGGRPQVTVAPGREVWSDAAPLRVRAGQPIAVSFELPRETPITTVHRLPLNATWTAPGAWASAPKLDGARRSPYNYFVTGLDVDAPLGSRTVVAFGDSITEGSGSDGDAEPARYPQRLAERLREAPRAGSGTVAVVNAGIGGNRLLADKTGPSGLERFDRDVLGQSGVSHVLILIGVNDIGYGTFAGVLPNVMAPSAEQLATGLQSLVNRAHARGVKVLLGTLLPFKGAGYWNEGNEAKRQTLNAWIRTQRSADGVVDFDAALRDAADPQVLNAAYDSGDHLHPNAAGTAAMAQAVDLKLLGR
ncbi:MAG: SGNH/GDSL hydrolase family protein [Proteobacteria bacterium]|nr:SGNH/GDSL hydrolase family protein [Pseudomonadota bacterium]